ncbi:tripartite ATP-independent transporter DctM subunit [Yoonia maritima]|uniref:Tripartite ATP-independent transporter DctM subunit n=2 Tax=Yoonia maritima TaxID=1435347 RepID=A0A2T0VTB0_9RHOB|nr:TRAP transporter large permease subunit [Yoonia maritima]PRY74339.1 tripartite ATP-independent transporter DctM subunit [Yoonia maritima]
MSQDNLAAMTEVEIEAQLEALKHAHDEGSAGAQTSLDRRIISFGGVFSFLFAIATVVSLYEIVMRYFFNAPTIWVHETVIALVAVCYLYGGMQCLAADKHIRIGLIYFGTSGGTRRLLDFVNALLSLFFAVAIAYAAYTMVEKSWWTPQGDFRLERSGSAWNPITPALVKMGLFITAVVLSVQSLGHIWVAFKGTGHRHAAGEPASKFAIIGIAIIFTVLAIGGYFLFSEGRALGIQTGSLLLVGSIMVLILTGIPLAFVTGLIAILFTMAWFGTMGVPLVSSRIYSFVNEYVLVAIPMFVLMASLLDRSGMARDLYDAMRLVAGRLKGGVAIQTLVAAVFLASISGIIGGEIVLLGLIALPQMLRLGYNRALAIGTVCAGGSLGTMIPPSIVLIVYGLTASVSIGDLFLATVTPGLMLATFYIIYIYTRCTLDPSMGPSVPQEELDMPLAEKLSKMKGVILPVGVAFTVLGSIYGGVASVTEAAAMGVLGVFVSAWIRGEVSWELITTSLKQTLETCGMIIWIGLGAAALVGVYNLMGGNRFIESTILNSGASPMVIVLIMMGILIVLGLFMDWIGIALLTMPIFVPIIVKLGMDPVWFGILFAMNMQVSYLSPPFGPAAFYLKSVAPQDISLSEIFRALLPFIAIQLFALTLVLFFPEIALWLPEWVKGD